MRRYFGVACCLLGGSLLLGAALTVVRQKQMEAEAEARSKSLLPLVEQAVFDIVDIPLNSSVESTAILPKATAETMPVLSVNGVDCVGLLSFPTLSLTLPVLADCTEALLETAPCRQFGSIGSKDLVIAGHNYRRHFKGLRDLEIGDTVHFTDMSGTVFHFTVAKTEVLLPDAVDAMLAGDWPLSLYTCTSGGEKRLTVRCTWKEE